MRAIGIILAGGNNDMRLGSLTHTRAAAAMPVGSCYRVIDFALSNMSSSGINKVAVITQYNSRSLHDHLMSSKWWDFGRKQGGLFVLSPFLSTDNSFLFKGTADSIYKNIAFLKRSNEDYVVITSGDAVYKMDYRQVIKFHEEKNSDITIVCKNIVNRDTSKFGLMKLDDSKKLTEFKEKPEIQESSLVSLGIYVISRELLIKILEEIIPDGKYDLVSDILIGYKDILNIFGYEFNDYWSSIGSGIMDYYNTNMDFLKKEIRDKFTKQEPHIETKQKDEPPVKYNYNADIKDSIIGNGSILNGKSEHSVLFRKVFVSENAIVKNSIIMEGCYIGNNSTVENAILDKEVIISDGKHVAGELGNPIIIKKHTIL